MVLVTVRKEAHEAKKLESRYPCGRDLEPFLPATKAFGQRISQPTVDKPTIQFIVEEALKSGIEDILVVIGKSKRSIEDHFDSNFELE